MPSLPINAQAATVDANGNAYVAGWRYVDGEPVEGEGPGVVFALDAQLQPRWEAVIADDQIEGLFFLEGRLIASRYPDVCVAIDPTTGAVLDPEAPILPSRMLADVAGTFLCDNDTEVMRVRPGLFGRQDLRFGFEQVPLFDAPPAPQGFFARMRSSPAGPLSARATFPVPLGGGDFVAYENEQRAALVRYDRAGKKSLFAAASSELQMGRIDDLQRAGDLFFLREDVRLLLAYRGVVSVISTPEDFVAFAALPGGDLVLFGDQRVLLARREDGYRAITE
jgi:hypothetical protein